MGDSVAGHPYGVLGPVAAPWNATKIIFTEDYSHPVNINRDAGQLPTGLDDNVEGVEISPFEDREGVHVIVGRNHHLVGNRTVCLKESVVCVPREVQWTGVSCWRRALRDVDSTKLETS